MEQQNTSIFDMIIWSGAAISLVGLLGIFWCIVKVARARRAKLADDDMQAVLQSVLPLNLGALFLSVIGLMMVGVGIAFS
ncbi:hypothetical protein [Pseudosulfitobacter sp. SM2401]|uniref:hypothetical protein n=1 Tax=Pseudosulfitobacter sp. SM2401 TaxID=3350098 RepID=UPI0036F23615